ncbi:hypothetical protein M422DRAFT_45319 [Sphaerobolus stellatus SS14]|nr:hypothetical protein M422DRAFT_45319 [Sphaerobolus stellatus SS14]
MSAIAALLQSFITGVSLDNNYALWNMASSALVVYDHILTLPQEVQLVWPSAMGLAKGLYFATKYLTLLDVIFVSAFQFVPANASLDQCPRLLKTFTALHIIGMSIAEGSNLTSSSKTSTQYIPFLGTLIMRTWAIWSRDKRIGYGLLMSLLAICGVSMFIIFAGLKQLECIDGQRPVPDLPNCLLVGSGFPIRSISTCFILICAFESGELSSSI